MRKGHSLRMQMRSNAVRRLAQPAIITDDFKEACQDAIDWVLPDLTLITLDQAKQMKEHYDLS